MGSYALLQTHRDLEVIVQIFHKLIRSTPTSGDAQAMHSTILSIVSARLESCFRTLKRRHPTRTDIEPLLQALKSHLHYARSVYASVSELEQWTTSTNTTLATSLRHTVQQLSQWASTSSIQPNPPNYTHRQIYAATKFLGTTKTLRAIIDEVKAQTEAGNGPAALDIGTSLICAPMTEDSVIPVDWVGSSVPAPQAPRTRANLREVLKVEFDSAASLVSTDLSAAETTVRLHRRVEALLAIMAQAVPSANVDLSNVDMVGVQTQSMSTDLDKAMNDAVAAGANMTGIDNNLQQSIDQQLDLSAAGASLDLSAIGVGDTGAGDMSGGIDDLPGLNLNIGDMGMGMDGDGDDWGLSFENM